MSGFEVFAQGEKKGWAAADIVDAYVAKFGPVTDDAGRQMIARHEVSGMSALDLCCGQGNLTAMLAKAGADVVGLDFSAEMLARARAALPDTELIEADAAAMPLDAARFDFVFCNFGMMHVPDAGAVLDEVARVLKPAGTFAMATWEAPPRSPAFGTVFGAIKAHADFSKAPPQPDLFAFTQADYAKETLARAGMELTAHDTVQSAWHVARAEDFFDIFLTATVGARMLLKSQNDATVKAIEVAVTAKVADTFATENGYRIPVPVCILEGRKSG